MINAAAGCPNRLLLPLPRTFGPCRHGLSQTLAEGAFLLAERGWAKETFCGCKASLPFPPFWACFEPTAPFEKPRLDESPKALFRLDQ